MRSNKSVRTFSISTVILLLALTVGTISTAAQLTTGTITGSVTDETKAFIPGVDVTVTNTETGLTRTILTNEQGRFEAPNLPVGTYEVTARITGFGTAVRRGIILAVGRTAVVDLTLPVATRQEEVVVTASRLPQLISKAPWNTSVISSTQLKNFKTVGEALRIAVNSGRRRKNYI